MKKSPCIAGASLDGPIFEKLEDARNWCIYAMIDHYDRRLGMSDARIEPFKGAGGAGVPQFLIPTLVLHRLFYDSLVNVHPSLYILLKSLSS
jgi:hypothetical protein